MTVQTTCRRCREQIVAVDEDDLVSQVQQHAEDHGGAHGTHVPGREQILAHLARHPAPAASPDASGPDTTEGDSSG